MSGADFCWNLIMSLDSTVTMETPVPGVVPVGGDVTADVDDIICGDGRVNVDRRVREEMPLIHRHWYTNTPVLLSILLTTALFVVMVLVVAVIG